MAYAPLPIDTAPSPVALDWLPMAIELIFSAIAPEPTLVAPFLLLID